MNIIKNMEMQLANDPPPATNCSLVVVVDMQLHVDDGLGTETKMGRA